MYSGKDYAAICQALLHYYLISLLLALCLCGGLVILFFFHPHLTPSPTIRATNSTPLLLAAAGGSQANSTTSASSGSTHPLAIPLFLIYIGGHLNSYSLSVQYAHRNLGTIIGPAACG